MRRRRSRRDDDELRARAVRAQRKLKAEANVTTKTKTKTKTKGRGKAKAKVKTGMALLKQRICAANIPPPRPGNLRIATWNIRELGKGARLDESLEMIAAIIGAFDLVSIVELRDDLRDLAKILRLLGSRWDVVFSDYVRDAGGNRERVAFVWRRARSTCPGSMPARRSSASSRAHLRS